MGIADIIPGVSGGTIAIITGIYEEFLSTLNNINLKIIKLLFKGKFKFLWEKYNLSFLSKNLYNQANYRIRQSFINEREYLNYNIIEKQLQNHHYPCFCSIISGCHDCPERKY